MGTKHSSNKKVRKLTFIDECQFSYFILLLSITRDYFYQPYSVGGVDTVTPLFRMKNASVIRQVRCLID